MSLLNITRQTFLEKEELIRFQDFLEKNLTRQIVLSNTTSWGIIRSRFIGEDLNFKVETGTNIDCIKIGAGEESNAVSNKGLLIKLPPIANLPVVADARNYGVVISQSYRRHEEGYVSVDSLGSLSGNATSFTQVLRGQSTEVPTKIKFIKDDGSTPTNSGVYEVIDVGGDIIASLTSPTGFVAESNLRMVVIGATPIGTNVTGDQLSGLYKYDHCTVSLRYLAPYSPISSIIPIEDEEFLIAIVNNNASNITISDYRNSQYCTYWSTNIPGVNDRLSKYENLNDLASKSTARTNLDVYSKAEAEAAFGGTTDVSDFMRKSQNLNDLTDKTTARSNLGVYEKTESDSRYMKMSNTIGNDYFNWVIENVGGDGNTSRISLIMGDDIDSSQSFQIRNAAGSSVFEIDSVGMSHFGTPVSISSGGTGGNTPTTARTNLDVYSKSETDTQDGLRLAKANNLSDLQNTSTARDNLSVYDKVYVDKYRPFAVGTIDINGDIGGLIIGTSEVVASGDIESAVVTSNGSNYSIISCNYKASTPPSVVGKYRLKVSVEDRDEVFTDKTNLVVKWGIGGLQTFTLLLTETGGVTQSSLRLHIELVNTY